MVILKTHNTINLYKATHCGMFYKGHVSQKLLQKHFRENEFYAYLGVYDLSSPAPDVVVMVFLLG